MRGSSSTAAAPALWWSSLCRSTREKSSAKDWWKPCSSISVQMLCSIELRYLCVYIYGWVYILNNHEPTEQKWWSWTKVNTFSAYDGFHGAWLHFWRAKVRVCIWVQLLYRYVKCPLKVKSNTINTNLAGSISLMNDFFCPFSFAVTSPPLPCLPPLPSPFPPTLWTRAPDLPLDSEDEGECILAFSVVAAAVKPWNVVVFPIESGGRTLVAIVCLWSDGSAPSRLSLPFFPTQLQQRIYQLFELVAMLDTLVYRTRSVFTMRHLYSA